MSVTLTVCADASFETGYGHLYRSLLVGETCTARHGMALRAVLPEGHDADFLARRGIEHSVRRGSLHTRLQGYATPDEGPLLIDSYTTSRSDLIELQQAGFHVSMFDDGNRLKDYDVDVLVDSTPGAERFGYRGAARTRFLLGPAYFPLRSEFRRPRTAAPDAACRLVVTFGGSDPDDVTFMAFQALQGLPGMSQTYILGAGYRGRLTGMPASDGTAILRNITTMGEVLAAADIVLCGGGGTSLEAASMGLPLAIVILSPDQVNQANSVTEAGAGVLAGNLHGTGGLRPDALRDLIVMMAGDAEIRRRMSAEGPKLVDGKGAERVADAIKESMI